MKQEPFVAIGLLTQANVQMLGPSLRQIFPIPQDRKFDPLVRALDRVCGENRGR